MDKLEELVVKDKFVNLEHIAEVLQEEISSVARNFFLLSDDVVVRFRKVDKNYVFNVEIPVCRIKPFGNKFI